MSVDMATRLECGADPAALLDQVAEGANHPEGAHQLDCGICQAVIAELTELWEPVRGWATQDLRAPAWLVDTVMRRVRRTAGTSRETLAEGPKGRTSVADRVLVLIAGPAALDVPGVAGSASREPPEVVVDERGRARVRVEVSAHAGAGDLVRLAERVRQAVADALEESTGLCVEGVDVTISDLT